MCCSLFCCFYLPKDSSSMCSAKNTAAGTYSCHTYTLPISQMNRWRWTLLHIHPHPHVHLLSSHHLFFIIMPSLSLLTADIDRWMDEALKEFTGREK